MKLDPYTLLAGMENGAVAVENSMEFLKKLNKELLYDLAIPLLNIYPKEMMTGTETDTYKSVSSIFSTAM